MSTEPVYRLASSTAVEPLVNKWVAWAHIVPPVPSSLHLQHYQIKLLESYLKDPKVHVQACQTPKLRSGPFVDIPEERAGEVRSFLEETRLRQKQNIELANSTIEFQNYLVKEAKGQSLEPYYRKLPQAMRGYVELIYDYYNRATMRFFENLLYDSPYYDKGLQSLRIFNQRSDNSRQFIMSTPRLPQADQIDWVVPFESHLIDDLFKLDYSPRPLGYIREILGLSAAEDHLLLPLLSSEPVQPAEKWTGPGVRIRYIGHASVLIEWNGVSILTDPHIGLMPSEGGIERLTYDDLPEKIDYVLITHNHHDHFSIESLLRLRHRIECLVVPQSFGIYYGDISLKLLARKIGFKNIIALETLESIPIPDGKIIAIPFMGEHADLAHGKTAFVVRAGSEQMLFAADSNCLDEQMYENIRRVIGPIETVFLGMECVGAPLSWSCGPFFPQKPEPSHEKSRRYNGCDSTRGLKLLEAVGAQRIFIYAMGLEPWFESLLGLAYTEDATQIKESKRLLSMAHEEGFMQAKLLSGKSEIFLSGQPETQAETATVFKNLDVTEDQFIFD